ncbi:MAG TPA: hypothetical protein PKE39_07800 [Ignavibacteria bacterium]|nr:hypothetical protein [Ignavibacteria bacterium]HMQ98915.1 hypothetical protein [Ignavibacteria bacterium]
MLLKKLTEILKTFDKAELKQFRRFISSDYFNTNESVIKLFKLIAALYPEFDITARRTSPEALFRKIYGSRKYDEKTYRYLLSTLYSLLEKYLAVSLFERNDTEMKKYTIDDMTERRLFGLARKNLAVLESVLDKNNLIGGEYIYNKEDTNLIWHQLYFLSNIQEPILEKRYEWGEVQLFSSFVELSHVYQILHQVSQSYNIPLKENIVFEYLRNINYRKILEFIEVNENNGEAVAENGRLLKVLKIYLCFMITILDEKDEKYFNKMNDYVGMYSDMFGKNELQNLHLMLTTCCNRKRTSLNDEKYQRINFEIIKRAASLDLYTSYTAQYMDVNNFLIIFQTALQLNESDWAAEFLRKYGEQISPEYSQDMTGYSFAELFFSKKQFERSLASLSKVKLKLFRLKLPVKVLMLKLYYELNYIEEAYSLIDSFSHFLISNKKIRKNEINNYLRFLNFYREILKAKAESGNSRKNNEIRNELAAASMLPHKSWLIEKAGELKNL